MSDDVLVLNSVIKHFGGVRAVDGCSFTVPAGALYGLIGPNGAGKSTVFNLVSGLLEADDGEILFNGNSLRGRRPEDIAALGLGRTFQTPRAFASLDVLENMLASASADESLRSSLSGRYRKHEKQSVERCLELLEFVGLQDKSSESLKELTGGELRMLEVARQLIRNPDILLLDEPTAGVSPDLQDRLGRLIRHMHDEGMTLVIVEHNLSFLLALAEHIVVLTNGSVLTQGTPEEIRQDRAVGDAYLGRTNAA
jgi:ABC-type branched-subunit amino acid transport system ATPase component